MNPSFNIQPFQFQNNNGMVDMGSMPLNTSIGFPMDINVVGFKQSQINIPFPIDANMGFQHQPQVNVVPTEALVVEQPQANVVPNDASSSSAGSSVRSFIAERKPLAPDFVPGPYDVICARGSAAANSPGNLRFRKTIQDFLPEYSKATTKLQKSLLVSAIVDSVRDKTPNGGFVKKFGDRWCEVGDAACREKIGQCLRDQLHTKYKSSTKAKKPRRKELKELKKKRQQQERQQKKKLAEPEPLKIPPLRNTSAPAKEDENGISLTNIFYSALVDDGLSLDNILEC